MSLEISNNRVWVKMLAQGCPLGDPFPECPMNELRGTPALDRLARIDRMSEQELDGIVGHHRTCLADREGR